LGSNFADGAVVLWKGAPKVTLFIGLTQLVAIISEHDLATVGTVPVSVQQGGVVSNTLPFAITSSSTPAVPEIKAVLPAKGSVRGNTGVTIFGAGFKEPEHRDESEEASASASSQPETSHSEDEASDNPGFKVFFGENELTRVSVLNSRMLRGVTPAHAAGPVDVSLLFSEGRRITLPAAYTYIDTQRIPPPANTGVKQWRIPYMVDSKEFRTNLGINNLDSAEARVTIYLVDNNGEMVAQMETVVPPHGMKQINNVARVLENAAEVTGREGYLLLESTSRIRA